MCLHCMPVTLAPLAIEKRRHIRVHSARSCQPATSKTGVSTYTVDRYYEELLCNVHLYSLLVRGGVSLLASIQFEILITPTVRTYYLTPGDTSTYTNVEVSGFSVVPLLLSC
jgi:hypothetical protein